LITTKQSTIADTIVLAEDVNDWMSDGVYDEIFSLEKHIAEFSSLVVLFVESAGSIAELGAFSHLDGVAEKLLVFMSDGHFATSSFIRLGPIKYLETKYGKKPYIYPWTISGQNGLTAGDIATLDSFSDEMANVLIEALKGLRTVRKVDGGRARDQMLIICDLIDRMLCLTLREITTFLRDLGISVQEKEIKRLLFVLQKLGLIRHTTRGNESFYHSDNSAPYIRYKKAEITGQLDRERMQFDTAHYYRMKDIARSRLLGFRDGGKGRR
jgi:hypothetical protein